MLVLWQVAALFSFADAVLLLVAHRSRPKQSAASGLARKLVTLAVYQDRALTGTSAERQQSRQEKHWLHKKSIAPDGATTMSFFSRRFGMLLAFGFAQSDEDERQIPRDLLDSASLCRKLFVAARR